VLGSACDDEIYDEVTFTVRFDSPCVAVTNIEDVPTTATVGIPRILYSSVVPANATKSSPIIWSVVSQCGTGATITGGNILNATAAGTVTIRATITNGKCNSDYTQDFNIIVNATFVPVANITGVPSNATLGTPLTLTGTVEPINAVNRTIVWSIENAGTICATITGNILSTKSVGTLTVRSTITNGVGEGINYTKDFVITVDEPTSNESLGLQQISVYPNPTNGIISLQFSAINAVEAYHVTISDMIGKFLFRKMYREPLVQIDIRNYPAGVYLLIVHDGKQQTIVRIVKY